MPGDELSFSWEWEPADSIATPELSATFARLNIRVGDEDVTLVEERSSRSSRRSITVSLYPLAEWIVYNWWNLLYDSRPSGRALLIPDSRHSMRAVGDGFIWPNLKIVPEGRHTRIAWQGDRRHSSSAPTRYLTSGDVLLDSRVVVRELTNLVEATLSRLREMEVRDTPLEAEWSALSALDGEETEFCIAVARLGLDPFGDGLEYEKEILTAADYLHDPALSRDFFQSVTVSELETSLAWVTQGLSEVREGRGAKNQPASILRRVVGEKRVPSFDHPWRTGWEQATVVRQAVSAEVIAPFDLSPFLHEVSVPVDDRQLVAIGEAGDSASPIVVVGRGRRETSRRFTLARALWRHVSGVSHGPFLISNAYSDLQKIERAFAAELLAPAQGVAELLDVDPSEAQLEDLEVVADAFGVAATVVQHQVENQLLGAA